MARSPRPLAITASRGQYLCQRGPCCLRLATLHRKRDGRSRSVVNENEELQEISPEQRYGLLPGSLDPADPDQWGADNTREVDRREADSRKDKPAREQRVRVDSTHASDLRHSDLLHTQPLDYSGINCADARARVNEGQASGRRRNRLAGLLQLSGESGRHFDLDRDNRASRLKAGRKRLMWRRRRSGRLRRVSSVIDGHPRVRAPRRVHSAWARCGGFA